MGGAVIGGGDERVRALFLTSCVGSGGAGRSLAAYLACAGDEIEAHVVMPEPGAVGGHFDRALFVPELVQRIGSPPYRAARAIPGLDVVGGVCALGVAIARVGRIAAELQPDLIYCNDLVAKPIGAAVGARAGLPVVFHARNIHTTRWVENKVYQALGRMRSTALILCNSQATAACFMEHSAGKVRVVPNFLDVDRFDRARVQPRLRAELGLAPDDRVVGYVGRIIAWKGLDVLVRAFARVADRFPRAVLAVVGENDPGLRRDLAAEYRALADRLGVGHRVRFLGYRDDVRPYVADFDVLALPSIAPEPFGRVLIEAMALGVPVVASAHGGAVEVVRDGVDGLLARPRDAGDLADKLAAVLADDTLRRRLGRAASAGARARFDGRVVAPFITEQLREVARARRTAPRAPARARPDRTRARSSRAPLRPSEPAARCP